MYRTYRLKVTPECAEFSLFLIFFRSTVTVRSLGSAERGVPAGGGAGAETIVPGGGEGGEGAGAPEDQRASKTGAGREGGDGSGTQGEGLYLQYLAKHTVVGQNRSLVLMFYVYVYVNRCGIHGILGLSLKLLQSL